MTKAAGDPEADCSETSPLLPSSRSSSSSAKNKKKPWSFKLYNPLNVEVIHPRFKRVPLLAAAIILANEIDFFIKHVPMMRMIESLRCIEYYQVEDPSVLDQYGHKIPERLCKSPVIQTQVARTAGLIIFFLMTCALIGAVPLGRLADVWGRKWILVLNKFTWVFFTSWHLFVYLTYPLMPIWSFYFSGALALTGGNFDFGLAIFMASITDIVPSNSDRVSIFFILSSMLFVAQLSCPPLGGILLDLDGEGGTPWVPYVIADTFMITATLLTIVAYPETLQPREQSPEVERAQQDPEERTQQHPEERTRQDPEERTRQDPEERIQQDPGETAQQDPEERAQQDPEEITAFRAKIARFCRRRVDNVKSGWNHFQKSCAGLGVPSLFTLGFAMLCFTIGVKSIDWYGLMQYATLKLKWRYSETTITLSLQALINILTFSFLIPYLIRLSTRAFKSSSAGSLAALLASTVTLTIGVTIVGFSTTTAIYILGIVIYTTGEGFAVALQAYVSSLVSRDSMALVLSTLSLTQTGGKLLAAVLFPKVLALGLDTHVDILVGLPCFAAAGLFVVSGICIGIHALGV